MTTKQKTVQVTEDEARRLGAEVWYRVTGNCRNDAARDRDWVKELQKKIDQARRAYELMYGVKL